MKWNLFRGGFVFAAILMHVCSPIASSLNWPVRIRQDLFEIAELNAAWQQCDSATRLGEWELIETNTGSTIVPVSRSTINVKRGEAQSVVANTLGDGSRSVRGLNRDYRFILGGTEGGQLHLKTLFRADEVDTIRKTTPDYLDSFERHLVILGRHQALHMFAGISWNEIANSSGFRIRSCRNALRDGEAVFEFEFDYTPDSGDNFPASDSRWSIQSGQATIYDKEKYFLPLETRFQVSSESNPVLYQTTSEYDFDYGPVPQLRKQVVRRTIDGNTDETSYSYKTISVGVAPKDEEFRLTAFGIPEPKGLELPSKGWPWWVKLPLAGIVAVGIAALFKRSINKGKK